MKTLRPRGWLRKESLFYKLIKAESPAYIFQQIPETRQKVKSPFLRKKNFFKNSFFPAILMEWNKIDVNIPNSTFCNVFKRVILKFIRSEPDQVFNVDSTEGLKSLTRIRLGLSHLTNYKNPLRPSLF